MSELFSQRYGYVKVQHVLIREQLTGAVLNSVINCIQELYSINGFPHVSLELYRDMVQNFRRNYLRIQYGQYHPADTPTEYINTQSYPWFRRLDVVEWMIEDFRCQIQQQKKEAPFYAKQNEDALNAFIDRLNRAFEQLNYAYRIIGDRFVETTSSAEIAAIKEAIEQAENNVVTHLQECLRLISPSNPEKSVRNAIKEAISAVEVTARELTGANTLDEAFKKLTYIHPMIKNSMNHLYQYTNQKDTGIRHGWMEQSSEPTSDEAIFVLVTSCSFINYLNKVKNAQ
ncbi:MAG: hypothetical protein K2K70_03615 [Lachnospiraceae bacterium]|nr:hypothetical protein [Lachnospiraceae bacterium]